MEDSIKLNEWLQVMESEYLSSFVPAGGSTIKFCVLDASDRPAVTAKISEHGENLGYWVVRVDGESARVHMMQDIFLEIGSQIDWRVLARRAVIKLAEKARYRTDGIDVYQDKIADSIAELNGVESDDVFRDIRPFIRDEVLKDSYMARDFRVALTALCTQELIQSETTDYMAGDLVKWLSNSKEPLDLKQFLIYKTAINRVTAIHFLESLSYCLHWVGLPGLMVLIDNTRIYAHPNPKDGVRYYTRPMVMDHYEVLRNFVDGVDEFLGIFMVVITDPEFLNHDNDSFSRGFGMYTALETRLMNDVHDRTLVNPVSTVVRPSVK